LIGAPGEGFWSFLTTFWFLKDGFSFENISGIQYWKKCGQKNCPRWAIKFSQRIKIVVTPESLLPFK